MERNVLKRISDCIWEIPKEYRKDMRVPGRIFASEVMLEDILRDESLEQVVNVATLPGIRGYSLAMPDVHEGYGFPVGGVAATDRKTGVISPGGIGFDINCGIRLLRSEQTYGEAKKSLPDLATALYEAVPSGVGRRGKVTLVNRELDAVLEGGVERMRELGYATDDDVRHCESSGRLSEATGDTVSKQAKDRGRDQLGTMGAGNHFVEIERVHTIFDHGAARQFGLFQDQLVAMIHCGSRGLGHQIATDYIQTMLRVQGVYAITVPDRELACAPFCSPEGERYFAAMSAAANFAWANRQMIAWEIRRVWEKIFGAPSARREPLQLVYDVAHNIAKVERYALAESGKEEEVVVHRKGATRAFPGEPVLIPGSMGTASYVLVGAPVSLRESFGSSCHGAGRTMSRTRAKRTVRGATLKRELEKQGIHVRSGSLSGLAEEAPVAYKDIEAVVEVVHAIGIAKKVARLVPVAVIKG